MYHTLITPAGFTFSIWGVIYGLLLISMIVMVIKHKDFYYKRVIDNITHLLWVTFITNMLWIVTFSYLQIGISTIFIFVYFITLILIINKLRHFNFKIY